MSKHFNIEEYNGIIGMLLRHGRLSTESIKLQFKKLYGYSNNVREILRAAERNNIIMSERELDKLYWSLVKEN